MDLMHDVYNGVYGGEISNASWTSNWINFDIDEAKLLSLGFRKEEIDTLRFIITNNGRVSMQALISYGLSYDEASRIKYMYDICIGKVAIDDVDSLCKHLRKMFGNFRRLGIQDLALSKVSNVPRKAVVAGITDPTFAIYNSERYPVKNRMYDVVNVTNKRIIVETDRKPVLKYKQPKFVEGVVEILELKDNGKVLVAFDKKYCKLVNRFIIVGSLKRPEWHLGMVEIVAFEGSKVYVYAAMMPANKQKVTYNMGTQRIYDYGFFKDEIPVKLKKVAQEIYNYVYGVYATVYSPNQDYVMLDNGVDESDLDEIEIED